MTLKRLRLSGGENRVLLIANHLVCSDDSYSERSEADVPGRVHTLSPRPSVFVCVLMYNSGCTERRFKGATAVRFRWRSAPGVCYNREHTNTRQLGRSCTNIN